MTGPVHSSNSFVAPRWLFQWKLLQVSLWLLLCASGTCANGIYVALSLEASIDSMSGMMHVEEGDFNTAYSYFLEAFEVFLWLYFNPVPMNAIESLYSVGDAKWEFCGVCIGFVWSDELLRLESLWVFRLCNLFFAKESKWSWIW